MRVLGIRTGISAVLAAALATGCNEDAGGDGQDTDGSDSSGDSSGTAGTTEPTTSGGSGPTDCVPGNQDCTCLEGQCAGTLFCVMDQCLPGPDVDLDDDRARALAGVRVPIGFEVVADEFGWTQVDGPMTDLGETTASPLILDVPADAAGQSITLRLTTVRNSIEATNDFVIDVVDAQVEDAFADVGDPEDPDDPPPEPLMLGQTEGVEFFGGELWVASSTEATLTQVNLDGTIANTYDVGGTPTSLRRGEIPEGDDGVDVLYFADAAGEAVRAFVPSNQQTRVITDADDMGLPLGPVTYVVPAGNGDVAFTNGTGGRVFYYDYQSDTTLEVANSTTLGPNPHALQFGPDGYLFVGTVGKVWKVPIVGDDIDPDNDETIEPGPPELYLDVGDDTDTTLEIDGLVFDGTLNMFASASGASTLYLARYVPEGEATLTNSWTRAGNPLGRFIGLRHGDDDFSNRSLYFASGAEGRVGRVYTGVVDNL